MRTLRKTRDKLIAAAGLTVIWVLLWGTLTPLTVVGGLVVAAVVLKVFPLPPVTFAGRIHPWGVVRFVARFMVDLVVASAQVAAIAFRFGQPPRSAVIAVPLRVTSGLNLTLTSEALSLVPGSLIVEAHREQGVLYVHVLNVETPEDVERARRSVQDLERRIIQAFGSDEERQCLREQVKEDAP